MERQPNILLICSDQHNPAVTGCYGDSVIDTRNIDRLASEGITYQNAYCNQPVCVPSRMSFMTGRYPHQIGVLDNSHVLDSRFPTFAHMLVGAGYRTALAGRMHFNGPDQFHGYQERLGSDYTAYAFHTGKIKRYKPLKGLLGNGYRPDALLQVGQGVTCTQQIDKDTTAAAIDWLRNLGGSNHSAPFMLTVGYFSPHCPYIAEESYFNKYRGRVGPRAMLEHEPESLHPYHKAYRDRIEIGRIPEENFFKAAVAYYGLVDFLDDQIGSLLQALDSLGLSDDTTVIYFSDHGEMLGEHGRWHKSSFFEGSASVPLIVRHARRDRDQSNISSVCEAPVSLIDLFPTVCEMAGTDIPFSIEGQSLLGDLDPERPIFAEYHDRFGSHRMVRKGELKLNTYAGFDADELFDLNHDPKEGTNLSGAPELKSRQEELRKLSMSGEWSNDIYSRHKRFLSRIGYTEVARRMSATERLIEQGTITRIPGYDVAVSDYENRIDP